MHRELTLYARGRAAGTAALRLTPPQSPDESCSITMQPIAESPPPLADQPTLTCAELPLCGHRFAAMPLLTHFALNDMRCPMCRAGVAKPMRAAKSFPGCAWAEELDARREHNEHEEEEEEGDEGDNAFFAHMLQYQATDDALAHGTGAHLPLMATVHFYAQYARDSELRAIQRAPLVPVAYQRAADLLEGRPRFELGAAAAHELATTLHDMQARALDIAVGLWSPAHMRVRRVQRSPMLPVARPEDIEHLSLIMRGPQLRAASDRSSSLLYIPSRRAMRRLTLFSA